MKYTISFDGNNYLIEKNGVPLYLDGVGLITFSTRQEAEQYIRLVRESAYYISQGIPE